MSESIEVNALVRVKPELLERYTKAVQKQVAGRVGRVCGAFIPAGRISGVRTVSVKWMNRRSKQEAANADFWLENELEAVV